MKCNDQTRIRKFKRTVNRTVTDVTKKCNVMSEKGEHCEPLKGNVAYSGTF